MSSLNRLTLLLLCCVAALQPRSARAWGDEGHEVVALIAEHYLTPAAQAQVQTLLAGDRSGLTTDTSMTREAVWADRYRDSDRFSSRERYERTHRWHFVDLELAAPSLEAACFSRPALPANTPASDGPAEDCVVDKIEQFDTELHTRATAEDERRLALQFLLHFVGDVHQPLHAIDDHDEGGNAKRVSARGVHAGSLHHEWDTEFVQHLAQRLGVDSASQGADRADQEAPALAAALLGQITATDLANWRHGSADDWARESYSVAKATGYDPLPAADARGHYRLSTGYVEDATTAVSLQLRRAGVRLAMLLNRALGN